MKRMSVRLLQILAFLILAMGPTVQCASLAQLVGSNPHIEVTGSLHDNRYGHTATLMTNGHVARADEKGTHRSIQLYDPAAGVWNPMP